MTTQLEIDELSAIDATVHTPSQPAVPAKKTRSDKGSHRAAKPVQQKGVLTAKQVQRISELIEAQVEADEAASIAEDNAMTAHVQLNDYLDSLTRKA